MNKKPKGIKIKRPGLMRELAGNPKNLDFSNKNLAKKIGKNAKTNKNMKENKKQHLSQMFGALIAFRKGKLKRSKTIKEAKELMREIKDIKKSQKIAIETLEK